MPEPTASTSHQTMPLRTASAALLLTFIVSVGPALGQTAEIAKQRNEAQKLKKPLIEDFEVARSKWRREKKSDFDTTLYRGPSNRAARLKIAEGIEHHLKMMTNPELRQPDLQSLREKFLKTMDKAGSLITQDNQKEKVRRETFDLIVQKAPMLLNGNYFVREQMIVILGSLNVTTGSSKKPYAGSRPLLVQIAKTSPFPEHRLLAIQRLMRLIRFTKLAANEEMEIAGIMADELMKPGLPDGAYYLLGDLLGYVNYTFDVVGTRKPSPTIALMYSMCDKKRSWITRAVAARSLGNTGDAAKAAGMRWDVIAWKIAEFMVDAATEFERQRAAGNKDSANPVDQRAMFDILLSFVPDTKEARDRQEGLRLRSNGPITQGAYVRILPLVEGAISTSGRINKKDIQKLRDWLDQNRPTDMKYHDRAPAAPMQAPPKQPPANGNQGGNQNEGANSQTARNMPPE